MDRFMQFSVKTGLPADLRTACLIVPVFSQRKLSAVGQALDEASKSALSKALKRGDIDGSCGQTLMLYDIPGITAERLLLLGCGKEKDLTASQFGQCVDAAARQLDQAKPSEAVLALPSRDDKADSYSDAREAVIAAGGALYRFDECKSEADKPRTPLRRLALLPADKPAAAAVRKGISHGQAVAEGMALTKDLANLPGNICTPTYLAEQARKLGRKSPKLKVSVLTEQQMEKLGMGALLSVSRGSRQPAKLIVMEYKGGKPGARPVALVGKGLTFDAGGISIKPSEKMDEMKYDMCGGASVLGTLATCVALELPINVVGVVPASENLPDGEANKPGDIVTSMSGQTIEILNTDAEGRLILCDALTYTERFKPAVVVDIATLTGACIVALGNQASGLMANDDGLAGELLAAGQRSGDRAWRLPLWEEYQSQLDSNFADMANIGGRPAGTITAACFLSRYTKKFKWAHLDIAGTAWKSNGKEKGATGRPVPLLTQFLLKRCKLAD
jgi:leucyl aminopeptidase